MILDAVHQTIDLTLEEALVPEEHPAMLENLQGNILKSHGRDHVHLLLVQFTAATAGVRSWLRAFAANWLTSAKEQLAEVDVHRQQIDTGVFGSILLSAGGYRALGFSQSEIEARFGDQDQIVRFTAGMAAPLTVQALGDPDPATWEAPYRSPIHALVLLAAASPSVLEWASGRVERSLEGLGVVLGREDGNVLRGDHGQSFEPFGFADGRSQPVFLADDLEEEKTRGGIDHWNPLAPLGLALVPDPFMNEQDCFGSFLVFRKLEQNVKGFREQLRRVALQAGIDEELAGAFAVGRFKNGTPVASHRRSVADDDYDFNDFNFDRRKETSGARCPLHAHIRKTNPRGGSVGSTSASVSEERLRRIVRRGVPYDVRQVREDEAESGVGLLFLCFQANIGKQFAFIQQTWANAADFPSGATGVDPIIGKPIAGQFQQWRQGWDELAQCPFNFGQFVTLKGGEFFFAPSIPFLRGLVTLAGT
ncbi:MAG TPA: peroxidase [Thermoanaerobaculia bacterium]|jgi:Dyp-type peroxidase family|nr:peroxidase [Thermoanaerobaculia bacterium]